jgi:hypothetical protein
MDTITRFDRALRSAVQEVEIAFPTALPAKVSAALIELVDASTAMIDDEAADQRNTNQVVQRLLTAHARQAWMIRQFSRPSRN